MKRKYAHRSYPKMIYKNELKPLKDVESLVKGEDFVVVSSPEEHEEMVERFPWPKNGIDKPAKVVDDSEEDAEADSKPETPVKAKEVKPRRRRTSKGA